MFKPRIQHNFDLAASTYDEMGDVQRQSAEHLVHLIKKHSSLDSPDHILDVGSGTGFVIQALYAHFPKAHYIANDISPEMLAQASKKLEQIKHLSLHPGDAEHVFIPPVDVITSNLAFQFLNNLEHMLNRLWHKTSSLCFATITADTFKLWQEAHKKLGITAGQKKHYDRDQLEQMCYKLKPKNFHYDQKSYHVAFKDPTDFLKYVKKLGITSPDPSYPKDRLGDVINLLKDGFEANYEIFYAVLEK